MATKLVLTGAGTIGELQAGWSVQSDATPVAPGDSSGSVGQISASVGQGEDSEFVVNNPSTFTHDRLGSISGMVSTLDSNGSTEAMDTTLGMTLTTPLDALSSQRDALGIPGSYLYTGTRTNTVLNNSRNGIDGTAGQFWTVNGISTGAGTANIEIASYLNGFFQSSFQFADPFMTGLNVDPYKDSWYSATRNPANGDFYLLGLANNVPKVYRFSSAGAVLSSWGALGTAAGQLSNYFLPNLNSQRLIGWSAAAGGRVYVLDVGNRRVQWYGPTGTYVSGVTVVINPVSLAMTTTSSSFYVLSYNVGAVYQYSTAGASQGIISLGFTDSSIGSQQMILTPSSLVINGNKTGEVGNRSIIIDTATSTIVSNVLRPGDYDTPLAFDGRVFYSYSSFYVMQRHVGMEAILQDAFSYYFALSGVLESYYTATVNPAVVLPPWSGDVWDHVKQLCSAYAVEIAVVSNVVTVRDIGVNTLIVDNLVSGTAKLSLDSQSNGQYVKVAYSKARYSTNSVLYDAQVAGNAMSVSAGSHTSQTVTTTNYPTVVNNPTPTDATTAPPGTYYVLDANNVHIPVTQWVGYGGSLVVSMNPALGSLDLILTAPNTGAPYASPFTVQVAPGVPGWSITGVGVFTDPATVNITTGSTPGNNGPVQAADVNNFAIGSIDQAYNRGEWAAALAGEAGLTLSLSVPTSTVSGFGLCEGSLISFKESTYRVITARIGNGVTAITATKYVTVGAFDTFQNGKTVGQFDTFWNGNPAENLSIKPYRAVA